MYHALTLAVTGLTAVIPLTLIAAGCGGRAKEAAETDDASSKIANQQPAIDASSPDSATTDSGDAPRDGFSADARGPQNTAPDAHFESGYSPLGLAVSAAA